MVPRTPVNVRLLQNSPCPTGPQESPLPSTYQDNWRVQSQRKVASNSPPENTSMTKANIWICALSKHRACGYVRLPHHDQRATVGKGGLRLLKKSRGVASRRDKRRPAGPH